MAPWVNKFELWKWNRVFTREGILSLCSAKKREDRNFTRRVKVRPRRKGNVPEIDVRAAVGVAAVAVISEAEAPIAPTPSLVTGTDVGTLEYTVFVENGHGKLLLVHLKEELPKDSGWNCACSFE
jgi:hypothetical protein